MSALTEEMACHVHEEVTRHVHPCRVCRRGVCGDCRETQYAGGSVPTLICFDCLKLQQRAGAKRRITGMLGIVALVGLVLAVLVSPYAFLASLAIGAAWAALSWRRIRSGVATPWDFASLALIFRRFLP